MARFLRQAAGKAWTDCPSLQAAARVPSVEASRALCPEEVTEPAPCLPGSDWLIDGPRKAGGVDTLPLLAFALDLGDFWNECKENPALGYNVSSQKGDKCHSDHHDPKAIPFNLGWNVL